MDEEGDEVCGCDYKLYWNQGPFVNQVTSAKVGDICLVQEDKRMKPKVVTFLKEARRQLLQEAPQGNYKIHHICFLFCLKKYLC